MTSSRADGPGLPEGPGRGASEPEGPGPGAPEPDEMLRDVTLELAEQASTVVSKWVRRCVDERVSQWQAAGGRLSPGAEGAGLEQWTADAATAAANEVRERLHELADRDVDRQSTTPLAIVRAATAHPAKVLERAGVAPLVRDDFETQRFPWDLYGLVPGSLASMDPDLGALGAVWGAAKAQAHRSRHDS